MLKFLRRAVKSVFAKVLIALLIASFAVWGIGDIFSFRMDDAVAEVGETKVSAERYAASLQREQTRVSQQAGQIVKYDTLRALGIDRRVLAGLVRDAAFAEELNTIGISAPDKAVAEAIQDDPTFQGPGGEFSDEAYRGLLARQGMSTGEFEHLTRQLLSQQILSETVTTASPPLPGASVRIAAFRGETRDIAQVLLPPELADDPAEPDEETLRAFYDANPERYTEPERRYGRYIHVDIEKLAATSEPDEAALREAYEAEKDRFSVQPTRTIERIPFKSKEDAEAAIARINTGQIEFEALAEERNISEADLSLGTVEPDDLPAVTSRPVFEATETGVIGPVPTPVGSAVIRITELTEGGAKPFEEVRGELAERLATDAALETAPDIANRIEEMRAAGTPLEEIAEDVRLPLGSFEGLAGDGTLANGEEVKGFEASEAFTSEVFEALDLEERDIVETPDGGYLLVMVDRIEESALQPFEDIRDRVLADWMADARLAALEEKAAELASRLGEDTTMEDIASEVDQPLSQFEDIRRFEDNENLPSALVKKLFSVQDGGTAFARAPDGSGVILAQVTEITPMEPEALAASADEIDQVLTRSLSSDTLEYFGRALEDRHGAMIDQSVLAEVFERLSGTTSN